MRFMKIYVCVSLLIIVLLLGSLVGAILYAGKKISRESTTVSNKIDSFNQNVTGINKNLSNVSSQLQTEGANLSSIKSQLQTENTNLEHSSISLP